MQLLPTSVDCESGYKFVGYLQIGVNL